MHIFQDFVLRRTVLTSVTLLIVVTSVLACLLPARHATRVDPTEALRTE